MVTLSSASGQFTDTAEEVFDDYGDHLVVKSPITMFNPRCHVMSPCLINLHQCFHDKVVSALEKRKTETNYQEGKVLIHNCLHCFQICFQILDCYIHSLRRHAVVSACGFFAVIFRRFLSKKSLWILRGNISKISFQKN